jgi:hypothetical protein
LWKNGTPLWVEIWPKGLDCHGGADRFIEVCNQYFKRILIADRLGDELQPIDALAGVVRDLKSGAYTDGLLIPLEPQTVGGLTEPILAASCFGIDALASVQKLSDPDLLAEFWGSHLYYMFSKRKTGWVLSQTSGRGRSNDCQLA